MSSAFSDSLASVEVDTPPKISRTTIGMTMKCLPKVVIHKEVQNQKNLDISDLVCKLKTKFPKILKFKNCANFTKFFKIVTIDVKKLILRILNRYLQIYYFTGQTVKCRRKLVCIIQNGL